MNDLEKSKDVPEVQCDYGSNINESKNSEASESTSFKDKIVERVAKAICHSWDICIICFFHIPSSR
jgi:hypothetical protein